jgi:hypothetical protein
MYDDNAAYAESRLVGTYMFNHPRQSLALITRVYNGNRGVMVDATDPSSQESHQELLSDYQFEVGKLGYVTTGKGAKYLCRMPLRGDYRQGLRARQLLFIKNHSVAPVAGSWLSGNVGEVSKTITDSRPPTIQSALDVAEEQGVDVKLSRAFAVSKNFRLLYKGSTVGVVNNNDKCELNVDRQFLLEDMILVVGSQNVA